MTKRQTISPLEDIPGLHQGLLEEKTEENGKKTYRVSWRDTQTGELINIVGPSWAINHHLKQKFGQEVIDSLILKEAQTEYIQRAATKLVEMCRDYKKKHPLKSEKRVGANSEKEYNIISTALKDCKSNSEASKICERYFRPVFRDQWLDFSCKDYTFFLIKSNDFLKKSFLNETLEYSPLDNVFIVYYNKNGEDIIKEKEIQKRVDQLFGRIKEEFWRIKEQLPFQKNHNINEGGQIAYDILTFHKEVEGNDIQILEERIKKKLKEEWFETLSTIYHPRWERSSSTYPHHSITLHLSEEKEELFQEEEIQKRVDGIVALLNDKLSEINKDTTKTFDRIDLRNDKTLIEKITPYYSSTYDNVGKSRERINDWVKKSLEEKGIVCDILVEIRRWKDGNTDDYIVHWLWLSKEPKSLPKAS